MSLQHVHRPGPLKQTNKAHKAGRKKNSENNKGKTDIKAATINKRRELNRTDRKNRAVQLRQNKKDEVLAKKRGLGGSMTPPILVGIIPLSTSQDPKQLLESIKACDEELVISQSKQGHCHISSPRFKQRFTFVCPKMGNLNDVLDVAKVADVLVMAHVVELDAYMEMLLSSIVAHALPTCMHIAVGLGAQNPKKKSEVVKAITKKMQSRFSDAKLQCVDSGQDFLTLLRNIGAQKRSTIAFRDTRPHLLAEDVEFFHDTNPETNTGILKVSGYLRGQQLDVNGLVHIPGWGDFQMSQIEYGSDPHPLSSHRKKKGPEKCNGSKQEDSMMFDETVVVDKADPTKQESLQSEVIPNPIEGEQTWPTAEELKDGYKASMIVASDEEISSDDETSSDDDAEMESETLDDQIQDLPVNTEQMNKGVENVENYDDSLDMDEEKRMFVRFKEEQMDNMFPDEQDTPADVYARIRYQKYIGLKSFKYSDWDPMQNLPPEYARIFRFENFKQMKNKVMKSVREGALPGLYVTLHITNVPTSLYDSIESSPLIIFGLLPHEQKMSLINVKIMKHPSCTEPIKSKDRLIFLLGYRRFVCQPIFSEPSDGTKHKLRRFLPSNSPATIASFYAPVIFPPCSAVVFQQKLDGTYQLVATGNVVDVNPDRLIIKRIYLSGHPFKISKNSVVVRYMFFNREDILWFQSIELWTKSGAKGNIEDPLGTHGHMKCKFNRQLKSQDVVLMPLYKRVYPKWTYDPCVPTPCSPYDSMDLSML